MPPGYMDCKKPENKYGDLLVWKEILDYAKTHKVDMIFVTQDRKEDWWNSSSGKTIGPRIELRKEFYDETGRRFHMYTMAEFLKFYNKDEGKAINKTTIEEVELIAPIRTKRTPSNEIQEYYRTQSTEASAKMFNLELQIDSLERKNLKRIRSINRLNQKALRGQLSEEDKLALQRNQSHLESDEEKIMHLRQELAIIDSYRVERLLNSM